LKYLRVAIPAPVFTTFVYSSTKPVSKGARVRVPFGKTRRTGYVTAVLDRLTETGGDAYGKIKEVEEVIDEEPLLTDGLCRLADEMIFHYISAPGEVYSAMLPPRLTYPKIKRKRKKETKPSSETGFLMNSAQEDAFQRIIRADEEGAFPSKFLLHGVNASGKTEIYLRLSSYLAEKNRQTLILLPEIAITVQMIDMFIKRFGSSSVGVWHSRISNGKKMENIRKIKNGDLKVLIGSRSAVFAPFKSLGGIVVDEEHDHSYKEGNSPFYDARWVSEKRGEIENAVVVYSSATPTLETMYRSKRKEINYLKIPQKVFKSDETKVRIVDMNHSVKFKGAIFSTRLLRSIEQALSVNKQIIIYINRRGYAPAVICRECGENIKCSDCSSSLVYHRNSGKLSCHLCGSSFKNPGKCIYCKGEVFAYRGAGTERVKKALEKLFPDANICRMDSDSVRKKDDARRVFEKFRNHKYDILVGTALVTKGWDFPEVELVGVLQAESALTMPDFRAAEKTFSSLKQVTGRSGRFGRHGEVFIQTLTPGHYAIRYMAERDYESFYEKELEIRKECFYPPYCKLVKIVGEGRTENNLESRMRLCAQYIKKKLPFTEFLGPSKAHRGRLRGKYRWQMLLKYREGKDVEVKEMLRKMRADERFAKYLKIDADPVEML